jgi:hypothetical protein
VEADGAAGAGQHARQVESVPHAQRGADLVGELGEQLIAATVRHQVQLGAHIEQGEVRIIERSDGRIGASHAVAVDELRERQRIEHLDVAQAAAARLEVGLRAVRDPAQA